MIGEQPRQEADPELSAKRAIDEAVETLRSLAEGRQVQPPPRPAEPGGGSSPGERSSPEPSVTLAARLREGFHRLGIVLATPCAAAGAAVVLLAASDLGDSKVSVTTGLALLTVAGIVYLFCRALAWVALGFTLDGPRQAVVGHAAEPTRSGVGGWLWLPILSVVSLLVLAAERAPELPAFMAATVERPTTSGLFLAGAVGLSYVLTAAWLYELYLMWRRRARARRFYVALSLMHVAFAAAFWLLWLFYFEKPADGLIQSAAEQASHAVWIPYMLRSRRVRHTFVT